MQLSMSSLFAPRSADAVAEIPAKEYQERERLRAQVRHQQNWWKRLGNQASDGQSAQLKEALLQSSRNEREACRREQEALTELTKVRELLDRTRASSAWVASSSSGDARTQQEEAQAKIWEMEAEMRAMVAKLEAHARIVDMKNESVVLSAVEESVVKLQAQNEALLLQLESPHLQSVLIERDETIMRLTAQVQEQQAVVDNALSSASREKAKAEELEERMQMLRRECEAGVAESLALEVKKSEKARQELASVQAQLQQYRLDDDKHLEQDQELRAMRASLQKSTTRYNNLKGQYDELRAERKRASLEAEDAAKVVATKSEEDMRVVHEQLAFVKSERDAALEKIAAIAQNEIDMKGIVAEKDALKTQLALIESERDVALIKVATFVQSEANSTNRRAEEDALKEELAAMKSERDAALEKITALALREAEVLTECDKVRSENDVFKKEKDELGIDNENWSRMFAELGQKHDELIAETHALKKEYADLDKRRSATEEDDLKNQLLAARGDLAEMSERLKNTEKYEQLHNDLNVEYDKLKKEVARLHQQMEELRKQHSDEELLRLGRQAEQSALLTQIAAERDTARADLQKLALDKCDDTSKISTSESMRCAEFENLIDESKAQLDLANQRAVAAEARATALLVEKQNLQQELAGFQNRHAMETQTRNPGVALVSVESSSSLIKSRPISPDKLTKLRPGITPGTCPGPVRLTGSGNVAPTSPLKLTPITRYVRPPVLAGRGR